MLKVRKDLHLETMEKEKKFWDGLYLVDLNNRCDELQYKWDNEKDKIEESIRAYPYLQDENLSKENAFFKSV